MSLLFTPGTVQVEGGLLTLAGTAVDMSSVQDPLTGTVSALWTDTSSGGAVSVRPQGGYRLDGTGGLAGLTSIEAADVLDVEVEYETAEGTLQLVTASHAVRLSATSISVDGALSTIYAAPNQGTVVLRLLRTPSGGLRGFVNGGLVVDFDWTSEVGQVVLEIDGAVAVLGRYLRRPVVVVGGAVASEVDVRGATRCLVNTPPRPVAGPEQGPIVAYRAAGAMEASAASLAYTAPAQISLGALRLPGGA